jgi:hypothetical protein
MKGLTAQITADRISQSHAFLIHASELCKMTNEGIFGNSEHKVTQCAGVRSSSTSTHGSDFPVQVMTSNYEGYFRYIKLGLL